jgi:hypothetical protein
MHPEDEEHSEYEEDSENVEDSEDEEDSEVEEHSEELIRRARAIKAKRLFVEDRGRQPYSYAELHFFVLSDDVERPIEPEDCDFEAARNEAADESS